MYLLILPLVMCFAPEWIFVLLYGKFAAHYWTRINGRPHQQARLGYSARII